MSLEKAIKSGKEHRDNYSHDLAKRVDPMCRNHGGCKWCMENRLFNRTKRELEWKSKYEESRKNR